ncbi:MAG: ABC transporter ATP-binding protein [Candidatus Nanopelagicales bacterium]
MDNGGSPLLDARGITAGYGKNRVLTSVGLHVQPGEIVGVLGHNGAGKTTLLKCLFRMHPLEAGEVTFKGRSITKSGNAQTAASGMSFTPSERPIFRDLSVIQNLELGAHTIKERALVGQRMEEVITMFPILGERSGELAGRFSGGQQRQLSLGMALMVHPELMLLDEPSLGISPAVVNKTFETIRELSIQRGTSVLIVEQNVKAVTRIADRIYVLRNGEMVLEESGEAARARTEWWHLF